MNFALYDPMTLPEALAPKAVLGQMCADWPPEHEVHKQPNCIWS